MIGVRNPAIPVPCDALFALYLNSQGLLAVMLPFTSPSFARVCVAVVVPEEVLLALPAEVLHEGARDEHHVRFMCRSRNSLCLRIVLIKILHNAACERLVIHSTVKGGSTK